MIVSSRVMNSWYHMSSTQSCMTALLECYEFSVSASDHKP